MPIDRDVLEAVREMDEHDLRRLVILAKARLENKGIDFGASPQVSLRSQHVKCGKPNCRTCPHGPYWYAYWTEGGRRRSRYVGKIEDEGLNPGAGTADTPRIGREEGAK